MRENFALFNIQHGIILGLCVLATIVPILFAKRLTPSVYAPWNGFREIWTISYCDIVLTCLLLNTLWKYISNVTLVIHMTEMILLPIVSLLTLWLLHDYLRTRLNSVEDRYMEHYGKNDWASSNMELVLQCTPQNDKALKKRFQNAISRYLGTPEGQASLLYEVARTDREKIAYETLDLVQFFDLLQPLFTNWFDRILVA